MVTPHPVTGAARVSGCSLCTTDLITKGSAPALGFAEFTAGGVSGGYNPCGLNVPVLPTTWGAIKALYAGPENPASADH